MTQSNREDCRPREYNETVRATLTLRLGRTLECKSFIVFVKFGNNNLQQWLFRFLNLIFVIFYKLLWIDVFMIFLQLL